MFRIPGGEAATQPLEARGGKLGHRGWSESVGTQDATGAGGLARPRTSCANAGKAPLPLRSAVQKRRSEGRLVVGDCYFLFLSLVVTPNSLRCFPSPGMEEGSWAPGHPETSCKKKGGGGGTFPTAGVPEGARGQLWARACGPCAPSPTRPGAQVPSWKGVTVTHTDPTLGRSPGGCSAGSAAGPCWQRAATEHRSGAAALRPSTGGSGLPHPTPQAWRPREGSTQSEGLWLGA